MRPLLIILLTCLPMALTAKAEDELVIELTGPADSASSGTDINLWNKNGRQLTKLLRNTTRQEVLNRATTVSSKDTFIQGPDNTRYALVQYGDGDNYRMLLFRADEPQTFLTCAADALDILAVNRKYQVNLPLSQKEFLAATHAQTFASTTTGTILKWDNGKEEQFFLFEKGQLVRPLLAKEAKALMQDPSPVKPTTNLPKQPARQSRKALLEGGTLEDQMYMPRVINPKPLPPVKPSKEPAGTPLWPQLLGK